MYSTLARGSLKRQTLATKLNAQPSRCHTLFSITVQIKEKTDEGKERMEIGKLFLVDLAGSVHIDHSGAIEKRVREEDTIDESPLTLGRLINSLGGQSPHNSDR